jgi:hypothetical protein
VRNSRDFGALALFPRARSPVSACIGSAITNDVWTVDARGGSVRFLVLVAYALRYLADDCEDHRPCLAARLRALADEEIAYEARRDALTPHDLGWLHGLAAARVRKQRRRLANYQESQADDLYYIDVLAQNLARMEATLARLEPLVHEDWTWDDPAAMTAENA